MEANRLLAEADRDLDGATALARALAILAHARVAAILGDREAAVAYLRQAMPSLAFADETVTLHTDTDFDSLRDYPPFQELVRPKR